MRSILLLSVLLFVVAVLATKDDVACVVHSDDCGRCVANGCNWCSDGYCVSKESEICESNKVATECGVKPIVQARQHGQRQAAVCESLFVCTDCQNAGCSLCVDSTTKLYKCSTDATCVASGYGATFEWWLAQFTIPGLSFKVGVCPKINTPASDSPTLQIVIQVYLVNGAFPENLIKGQIIAGLIPYLGIGSLTVENIIVQFGTVTKKRQSLDPTLHDATVFIKFADVASLTSQGIAATLLQAPGLHYDVAPDSVPVNVSPYLPSTGTGSAVIRNKSSGLHLSRGALAGIIIGCIIAGAIIIAVIAWFILRRRDAYPQAFRSPAAAYRP
jgi:hypothetical protein